MADVLLERMAQWLEYVQGNPGLFTPAQIGIIEKLHTQPESELVPDWLRELTLIPDRNRSLVQAIKEDFWRVKNLKRGPNDIAKSTLAMHPDMPQDS